MSTRATYLVDGMHFYCHYDGYPEGAAQRFLWTVQAMTRPDPKGIHGIEDRRGGLPFAFIRGNIDAEPTEGHHAHGDTEYRWNLTSEDRGAVTVTGYHRFVGMVDKWQGVGVFDLAEFINANPLFLKGKRVVRATLGPEVARWTRYATADDALAIADHLAIEARKFNPGNPNIDGYMKRARQWLDALEALAPASARPELKP